MTRRVIDFNAFRAEQKEEPVEFKIGEDTYLLPPTMPAALAVDVLELQALVGPNGDPESMIPPQKLDGFCRAIFGSEMWVQILDKHRLTLDETPELLRQVIGAYAEQDEEDPKATAS